MGDNPRLLHKNSQHAYTTDPTRAMRGEPEAISEQAAAELEHKAALERAQRDRAEWQRCRSTIVRQLDWLYSRREAFDTNSQRRALQRQLERIDKQIDKALGA